MRGKRWYPWATRPTLGVVLVLAIMVPLSLGSSVVNLAVLFLVNVLLAQGMSILLGYGGQISLGQGAIYGGAAYTTGILSVKYGVPLWLSIPAALLVAVLLATLMSLPAGRVQGFYLAIVTLGLGLLVYELIANASILTGGYSGLTSIPSPAVGNLSAFGASISQNELYLGVVAVVALFTWCHLCIARSHIGRMLAVVQTSEIAAQVLAIRVGSAKRTAYILAAVPTGAAGAIYAHFIGFLSPSEFSVDSSIQILVLAVLGGAATIVGPFLGAAIITYLANELVSFGSFDTIIYGTILLVSYSVIPHGLAGLGRRRSPTTWHAARDLARQPSGSQTPRTLALTATNGARGRRYHRAVGIADSHERPILHVSGVSMNFGGVVALRDVGLAVASGSIHGLVGPNGSGKSTLLNVISGIYRQSSGTVFFDGVRIDAMHPAARAAMGIGRTFQHPTLDRRQTVLENVLAGATQYYKWSPTILLGPVSESRGEGRARMAHASELIDRLGIADVAGRVLGTLPFGTQRIAELARVLMMTPKLLLVDEPAAGLSRDEIGSIANTLRQIRELGVSIVLVEHHLDFLFDVADAISVLDGGRVIFEGDAIAARADAAVREAYIGTGPRGVA